MPSPSLQAALRATERIIDDKHHVVRSALMAFSAGKDSIVMAHLLHERLGLKNAICDNSFWFDKQREDSTIVANQIGIKVAYHDRFGDAFVIKCPNWLFPPRKAMGAMFTQRQQKTVKNYALAGKYACIAYGRRTEENFVPSPFYQTADKLYQFHPLRHWSHTDIWEYISLHNLPKPRVYDHLIGKLWGSTPWAFVCPEEVNAENACMYPYADITAGKRGRDKDKAVASFLIEDFCPATHHRLKELGVFG